MAAKGGPASFTLTWNFVTDAIKNKRENVKSQQPDDNMHNIVTYYLQITCCEQ